MLIWTIFIILGLVGALMFLNLVTSLRRRRYAPARASARGSPRGYRG